MLSLTNSRVGIGGGGLALTDFQTISLQFDDRDFIFQVECVVLRDILVYVKLEGLQRAELHVSSISDLSHWTRLPSDLPTYGCALTTYHSQLVLVGGVDATGQVTNKLWTSDAGHNWNPSLPPMPTQRSYSAVVNTVSPECLVVVGNFGALPLAQGAIDILIGKQWTTVDHWNGSIWATLHNGRLYFNNLQAIHHCDVEKLIAYCTQLKTDQPHNSASLWSKIASPETPHLASFGQQLVTYCGYDFEVYSPITQTWMHIFEGVPGMAHICHFITLPTGDLLVFAQRSKTSSTEVFQASLRGEM